MAISQEEAAQALRIRQAQQITPAEAAAALEIRQKQPEILGRTPTFQPPATPEEAATRTGIGETLAESFQTGLKTIGRGVKSLIGLTPQIDPTGALAPLRAAELLPGPETEEEKARRETLERERPIASLVGQVAGEVTPLAPLGAGVGAFNVGRGLLTRLATTGGLGAAELGLIAAGKGETPSDIAKEAGIGAGLAAGAELAIPVFGRLAGKAYRRLTGKTDEVIDQAGNLIPEVQEVFEKAGVSIDDLMDESIRLSDPSDEVLDEVVNALTGQRAAERTGIDLFQAQKTLDPFEVQAQSFIPQLPAGSRQAAQALKQQNDQAWNAVNNFMNAIAPPESVTRAKEGVRTAAQTAIERAKQIRAEKASPLYQRAFRESPNVNVDNLIGEIDAKLIDLPETGQIARTLKKAKRLIGEEDVSVKRLHNAKLEIDQMLDAFGENALGNTSRRELAIVKDQLLGELEEQAPLYREAARQFAADSPPVTQLQDSIIGKLAQLDDRQLKQVASTIFDPAETNPNIIKNAKKVIEDVSPQAWNDIVRNEFERRLGGMRATEEFATENVPGQIYTALFGNKKKRDTIFNAVDGEARKNLKYLETALRRARVGRGTGSQTAIREEIKEELRGGAVNSIRNFFKEPLQTTARAGEESMFNARVRALADVLYDPDWTPEMTKIRQAKPQAAGPLMTSALTAALAVQAEQE